MARSRPIRLGTRKSPLAMAQARIALDRLKAAVPGQPFEVVPLTSQGDRDRTVRALREGRGLFVKSLQNALLRGKIDVAVHSFKDLPTETRDGLCVGGVLARGDSSDVLVSREGLPLERLPRGAVIGTASRRRQAFLKAAFPHLRFRDLRGNLGTRLRKLFDGRARLDGIVLAAAGIQRLYPQGPPFPVREIPTEVLPPAAAQGVICLECRVADHRTRSILGLVDHEPSRLGALAERAILRRLEGGCNVPVAARAEVRAGHLRLTCWVAAPDGSRVVTESVLGRAEETECVAEALEILLRNAGAGGLIGSIRSPAARNPSGRRRLGAGRRK